MSEGELPQTTYRDITNGVGRRSEKHRYRRVRSTSVSLVQCRLSIAVCSRDNFLQVAAVCKGGNVSWWNQRNSLKRSGQFCSYTSQTMRETQRNGTRHEEVQAPTTALFVKKGKKSYPVRILRLCALGKKLSPPDAALAEYHNEQVPMQCSREFMEVSWYIEHGDNGRQCSRC